ncbi:primosomal protein N' [Alkalinema pantanalense CENA528]|uniref:primosomal protein N' n=1 Tax=Alkalinema pantanalense TaxID=1620705 RepID=UPI003D6E0F0C
MSSLDHLSSISGVEISPLTRWIEVLVDCPGAQGLYTYGVPQGVEIAVGDVLTVPFGAQQVGAIVIRWVKSLPADLDPIQIRSIEAIVSRAFFPPTYWQLLNQVADYYQTSLMQVIRVALPPGLLTRSQRRLRLQTEQAQTQNSLPELTPPAEKLWALLQQSKTGDYSWKFIQQKVKGASRAVQELETLGLVESYLQPPDQIRTKQQQAVTLVAEVSHLEEELSDRQREVLEHLKRCGGEIWLAELLNQCQVSASVVKTLEKKGWVTLQLREMLRQEQSRMEVDTAKVLTEDQTQVLGKLRSLQGSEQVLLHGVTGSGKTEVYLQAIAPLLHQGKSALILVPEIGLTPQLTDRFRARFGDRVCVYHSALSDGERYDTWRQMLLGQPQVVIGTRSAIFAPLPNLGLIVLDEEHDSSFKQDQPAPCYHARTVAQWRSQLEQCPLILGSATPSFESWVMAQRSDSIYLSMPRRIHDRPMPQIKVVDMRYELQSGNRSMFSRALQEKITQLKQTGQQGILFIHRRGHSTHVSCRSCGYVMDCPNCDVPLAYHHTHADAVELLRCHYCGYTQVQPQHCPDCSSPYFKHFGSGTQKVTQELTKLFPEVRVLRFDSDTTRTKGAHRALLTRFANGEADLLVGTQMLTKGIDLPQVTLVGIVAADGILHLQDFRASERAFQTLLQVAGRSGRGADPGCVILQTYTPEHPVVQAVVKQDYAAFVEAELPLRATLNYPPTGRLILLRFSSPDAVAVQKAADRVAKILAQPQANYELLGPAPAAILRVAQRYRWQILVKVLPDTDPTLPDLAMLRSYCGNSVSLTIDIDPMNLL